MAVPDPNDIKADRQLLLELLLGAWPRSFTGAQLYRQMLNVGESGYEKSHFVRDLTYLLGKGYIEVSHPKLHKHLTSAEKYFRLTTKGSEIAQKIIEDPALEV